MKYDFPGNQENTASIGFNPCSISCDLVNDWEREPPFMLIKSIRAPARSLH
jgi:hypothetical protein